MILVILAFSSILVFLPGLHDSFGLAKLAYLNFIAVPALFSLLMLFLDRRLEIPLAPLLISYIIVLVLSSVPKFSHESLIQLSLDLTGILFFIYVVNRVPPKSIRPCVIAYVVIVLIMALVSLIGWRWPDLAITGRPFMQATMGNEKYPALLLLTALPLAFYLGSNAKTQWRKILFTLGTILLVLSLLVVGSRIMLGAFYPVLTPTERGRVASSFMGRMKIWNSAVPLVSKSIPLGVGRGNFQLHYPANTEMELLTTHAHNDYLELLIETGPFGLLFFLSISLLVLNSPCSIQGSYLKASVLAALLSAFFWFPFEIAPTAVSYWIFLGLIYVDSQTDI